MANYGGAPSWVYKEREAILSSSHDTQISQLKDRVRALEEENRRLKTQLEEANRKNEEHASKLR
jgi:predicted RNase H-like nuclease (RuvC/YqgF family)